MGKLVEERIFGIQIETLHDDQEHSQTDGHRRIEEMKRNRQGELNAGEDFDSHDSADQITFVFDSAMNKRRNSL